MLIQPDIGNGPVEIKEFLSFAKEICVELGLKHFPFGAFSY